MKNVFDWVKEIQKNEKFAEKFSGTRTVSEIIELAKKDGYDISVRDIGDLALNSVAGGGVFDVSVTVTKQEQNIGGYAIGDHSKVIVSPTTHQNIGKEKK